MSSFSIAAEGLADQTTLDQDRQLELADADAEERQLKELIEEDLLVEDISIDGMCGVY